MSRNALKIIACISMLIDHIGYVLFPQFKILRFIGRIALPIFAFFIAEGCRYTKSRPKYLLRVFSLAMLCQAVYFIEELISGTFDGIYLNILFTLSMSIVLCCLYLNAESSYKEKRNLSFTLNCSGFIVLSAVFAYICFYGRSFAFPIKIDYGFAGVMLPLFALIFTDKKKRFILFSCGLIIFNIATFENMHYIWFSLFSLIPLYLYNGEKGHFSKNIVFYAFYPLHMAAVYGVKLLFF